MYLESIHWTKTELLGTGAFSTCYAARDKASGTLMAVKQVKKLRVWDECSSISGGSVQEGLRAIDTLCIDKKYCYSQVELITLREAVYSITHTHPVYEEL